MEGQGNGGKKTDLKLNVLFVYFQGENCPLHKFVFGQQPFIQMDRSVHVQPP